MGEGFERLKRFGRNGEQFAQNDWNRERNAERFARNDWNGERNAEQHALNDWNGERNAERFALNGFLVVVHFRVCTFSVTIGSGTTLPPAKLLPSNKETP
jgi:hypothetical protein